MIALDLDADGTTFAPGDEVAGRARWQLAETPERVELRLFWFTEGKGEQDVGVVETVRFDPPAAAGDEEFRLRLPAGPYSFSGKLISLLWALELVAEPGDEVARQEILLSPTGREILLHGAG